MNKKNSMIMAAIFLCVAVVLFFGLSGKGIEIFRKKVQEPPAQIKLAVPEQAVPAEHQKSGGDAISPVSPSSPGNGNEQGITVVAGEQPQTIEIPEAGQRFIGMKTSVAAEKSLNKTIRTVGRVEYDERKIATVNTKIEGWLENLRVNYTGRYVKQGEVLAEIYSPELVASQQEYLNILKWLQQGAAPADSEKPSTLSRMLAQDAEALRQAARQRLRFWDISEAQIQKIEKTGQPLRTLALFSPVNGYVVQKAAVQGMKVQPGEKLFDLVDTSTVWVVSDIYEQDLAQVRIGQKAEITLDSLPGKVFTSTIEYVSPLLAGDTRTAKVRFTLENQAGDLKPQMFANVEIKIPLGKRLVVPDTAVIDTGARQLVYVDKGDGYFEPRTVNIGVKAEGMAEILSGMRAGEQVASAATFLIDSEARLKGAVQQ
jgi:Cu(I)/Ag(I) efflux system membrane fusion protein